MIKDKISSFYEELFEIEKSIKTTLGPRGSDKILINEFNESLITNDGYTFLKNLHITNPFIKLFVNVSYTQDKLYGDGTTSVFLLATSFLKAAIRLENKKISKTTIYKQIPLFKKKIFDYLEQIRVPATKDKKKNLLKNVLSGKVSEIYFDSLFDCLDKIVVSPKINSLESFLKQIQIKNIYDTSETKFELIPGLSFLLQQKNMFPETIEGNLLLLSSSINYNHINKEFNVSLTSVDEYKNAKQMEQNWCNEIVNFLENVNVKFIFLQGEIDSNLKEKLNEKQIIYFEHLLTSELEQMAISTNSIIFPTIYSVDKTEYVYSKIISRNGKRYVQIGPKKNSSACILTYCNSQQISEELSRAITDGLCAVYHYSSSSFLLPGGGSVEMALNYFINTDKTLDLIESIVFKELTKAMKIIPSSLIENVNLNPTIILEEQYRQIIKQKKYSLFFDIDTEKIEDAFKKNVIELFSLKKGQFNLSLDLLMAFLRIDEYIYSDRYQKK